LVGHWLSSLAASMIQPPVVAAAGGRRTFARVLDIHKQRLAAG
jgi:hypothetical protein